LIRFDDRASIKVNGGKEVSKRNNRVRIENFEIKIACHWQFVKHPVLAK